MKYRSHQSNNVQKKRLNITKTKVFVALIIAILVGSGIFFYHKYQDAIANPQAQLEQNNNSETKSVVESLGKILLLPGDKQPTVAKVEDVEKLKKSNGTFYKDISKDDYLVLYTDRAIIYRKKENKIINIAPIVDTSNQSTTDGTTTNTQPNQTTKKEN